MFKTVFFGTDEYAATLLEQLLESDLLSISLIITQPDKPVGRKKVLTPPPVKRVAEKHGIEILQPQKLRKSDIDLTVFDVGIVTRYGQIISKEMLDAPTKGLINIHPSLLPLYRGATPIQSTLIDGQIQTGVAIMRMNDGIDTGDILGMQSIPVKADDTYATLSEKLTPISATLLLELLPSYMDGSLVPEPQDNAGATLCQQFTKEDGRINWQKSAQEIYNTYRGIGHWPGLWTMLGDKRLKLISISPVQLNNIPGTIVVDDDTMYIGTSLGSLQINELQLEGKQAMKVGDLLRGMNLNGTTLV